MLLLLLLLVVALIKYYARYFDVSSVEFARRLGLAFLPIAPHPPLGDLYATMWIPATLIFTIAVTSNFAAYVAAQSSGASWSYNFHHMLLALSVISGYVGLAPTVLAGLAYWYDVPLAPSSAYSLYGYASAPLVPAAMACIIPHEIIRWSAVGLAFLVSAGFLVRNLVPLISRAVASPWWVVGLVVLAHAGVMVVVKMLFFEYVAVDV
ncbi:Yip1 domain family protein [Thecamonas trahens ATCC 50062]|uniref:Yip1 domain family protein n=1 Tax=Thecamonas trahens ATCC 50062 TaxID=461836 RepID=A0A0L0DBK5_THETB|nr:Yip1 domain family protein [Thecamonas trahens ATCC 50062]KNC49491.1 Yip1 domain family protein [Thecamonas trahens ATCC 50062]|eukprot:XP_013757910.1 Yip1 domain family protein [Thecamonas trahens ATCC 50062]